MAPPIDIDRPPSSLEPPAADPLVEHRRRRVRRRAAFVAGLLLIAVPGGLWAALTKDPIRSVGDREVFFDRPFIEEPAIFEQGFDEEFFPPPTRAPLPVPLP